MVFNTYCVVCCVFYVATFSGLFIFDCPFGNLWGLFSLITGRKLVPRIWKMPVNEISQNILMGNDVLDMMSRYSAKCIVDSIHCMVFYLWQSVFFRPCHSSAINLQTFNKGVVVSDCCLTPSERFFFSQLYRGENKCLLCVFTFWVPCCGVSHNFRIKTMFCSSLPLVVCMRAHVLFTLFVLVCM